MANLSPELAHDLRLPLQLIDASATLLAAELPPAPGPARTYAALLLDGVRQLEAMLEDSLAQSPDAAAPRPFDLVASLRGLCARCRPRAELHGVALRFAANAAALPVLSDEDRLNRAALNLLDNALRFTPPGGHVELRLTALGDAVEIAVADTGCGIPPERLPFVFLEGETTGGHGRGLPITLQLARSLGGSLDAASRPGSGSVFTLRLPLTPRAQTQSSEVS